MPPAIVCVRCGQPVPEPADRPHLCAACRCVFLAAVAAVRPAEDSLTNTPQRRDGILTSDRAWGLAGTTRLIRETSTAVVPWLSRTVNGAAIVGCLLLVAWGLPARYPGEAACVVFVPLAVLPYLVAIWAARSSPGHPAAEALLLACAASICLGLLDLFVVELLYGGQVAFARGGAGNGAPPPVLVAGVWLLGFPLIQLAIASISGVVRALFGG